MPGFNEPLAINIVGHTAGTVLFAIFLVLLFSGRGWSGARGPYLSGAAAGLALLWNLGSLIVLVFPGMPPGAMRLMVALSFSALSLLPAVLLHVWLHDGRKPIVAAGYLLSAVAVAMHFRETPGGGAALHQAALLLITIGFLLLTGAAVAVRRGGGRMAVSMSLALFATSFVHFGEGHSGQAWSGELFIHHAGIPLALFVLLQDYRFVLLDAFVRFLANALLAAVLTWGILAMTLRLLSPESLDPVRLAALAMGVCLCLLVFAWLRARLLAWLTRALFGQGKVREALTKIRNSPVSADEEEYLAWAAGLLGAAVRAESWKLVLHEEEGPRSPAIAVVPVRLGQGDSRWIVLGPRQGGQRYLRDDLDSLAAAAAEITAHVESVRRQELAKLAAQAELRALQSQIHPHFLFNALNTVYGTIPREASGARKMVLNLAEIFRYFLQTDRGFVPLSHEMAIVRAYLEVEQVRLGSRLTVEMDVDEATLASPIPVLSIQPLVENAIKHGVAQRAGPGYVRVQVRSGAELRVTVSNSVGDASDPGPGVGLQNVRRRLEICYGAAAGLDLRVGEDVAVAELRIPLGVG
ncbi:MAG TPA: histidine kinase [Candidatus Acidoferrum sp.]|nr:histidine kinase [Candidatus Acidoferrum sp.]